MAATNADKDYVHLLAEKFDDMVFYAYNYFVWETNSHDRSESFVLLDKILHDEIDLITVQLSENVSDITTFEKDFTELIEYIKKKVPHAQIVILGDFWSDEKDNIKEKVSGMCEVTFISMDSIRSDEYQCGIGTSVYDENGNEYEVGHEGVSIHPNDKAMKWIAEMIYSKVGR